MGKIQDWLAKLAGARLAKKLKLQEGKMTDGKKWYLSKGVWAGVVTFLLGAYEMVRMSLAPEFGWAMPEIPPAVFAFLGGLGLYARASANTKIG
jgi:hypothetical protein